MTPHIENKYNLVCKTHRSVNKLSTHNVEYLDCNTQCSAESTCPLRPH